MSYLILVTGSLAFLPARIDDDPSPATFRRLMRVENRESVRAALAFDAKSSS